MTSTIQKGDTFRDLVVSMLEAAGFAAETETRENFKKVDARWLRQEIDGLVRTYVETKDYAGTLGKDECLKFLAEYGTLVENGHADRAWLVSRGPISPDGRASVDAKRGLKALTFAEFQRRILGLDGYLQEQIAKCEAEGIARWYVPPHTDADAELEQAVRAWINEPDAIPLAIVAAYGKGKSTFALHLCAALAREALADQSRRAPVLVPLGEIVDEQSLEGLLGKVFTSRAIVHGYNFGLFKKLNQAGRFVVIFDGFDEMKHGMTLGRFEGMINELMRLDRGQAKLMVLGRDTAFHDDYEFRSIILGRQKTSGGQEVAARDRRPFQPISVRDFTLAEARQFVERYFPIVAREAARGSDIPIDESWIAARTAELLAGSFDALLVRPVHAQMLCQIATDRDLTLANLSKYGLFDRFVHFLLDREVRKRGRDQRFSLEVRRQFNRALALWLWEQGGVSTVTLASVPVQLCRNATAGVQHDYDETALRKELTAGCLIEKGTSGTIFFGHRSLQEFLVAEELIETDLARTSPDDQSSALWLLSLATPEVASFIIEAAKSSSSTRDIVSTWFDVLKGLRRLDPPRLGMRLLVQLAMLPEVGVPDSAGPWFAWLRYFVANEAADFAPNSQRAADELLRQCRRCMRGTKEEQAGIVLLLSEALSRPSNERARLIASVIAAWLDPSALGEAIQKARALGRDEHYYVPLDENLALWIFLHSARFEVSPPVITIDLHEAKRRMGGIARMRFAEDVDEGMPDDLRIISAPIQSVYRAWGLRESELERLRPYFGRDDLRDKIRPLEVVRPRRERDPEPPRPPRPHTPKPTLTLKRGQNRT